MAMGLHISLRDLRQELSVEGVLRLGAIHLVRLLGPTNIFVFLPDSSGDWTMGAIFSPDPSKRDVYPFAADLLANRLAPKFGERAGNQIFPSAEAMGELYDEDYSVLDDEGEIIVASGEASGEVLLVAVLFRTQPFPKSPQVRATVAEIIGAVAAQLERCIRVHYRHIPEDRWGLPRDSDPISN